MKNIQILGFGSALVLGFLMQALPVAAAAPSCTLKANVASAAPGSQVTLTWDSVNATYAQWVQNKAASVLSLSTVIQPVKASAKQTVGEASGTITPTLEVVNNSQDLVRVATISLPDYSNAIGLDIVGKYAYVVDAGISHQLNVVDISNPAAPVVVGSVSDLVRLNGAFYVKVVGNYAYVTVTGNNRLVVIDVSNPATPTIVGEVSDTRLANPRGLAISGSYAYVVGNGQGTFSVVDISNPAAPVVVGSVADATKLAGGDSVALSGSYAYVTAGAANALVVINIATPTNPTIVGGITDIERLGNAKEVVVNGKYAFVVSLASNSFSVIDISTPATPKIIGSVSDATYLRGPKNLAVLDNRFAYVTSSLGKTVTVIDLVSLTAPKIASSVQDATNLSDPRGIGIAGTRAYVVAGNKFNVFNLTKVVTKRTCATDLEVTGQTSASATINPRGQFALRGTAIGSNTLSIRIAPTANPSSIAYRNDAVSVTNGEWVLPLSLPEGSYQAEVYAADKLLARTPFLMP